MAMMDDPDFLVMHLRNSFITSDDTGMCEMIMESEDAERAKEGPSFAYSNQGFNSDVNRSDSGLDSSDCELSHSSDILPDMDYGAHRRRSNTSVRLEKLKKEKKSQVKIKHVSWKSLSSVWGGTDGDNLFEKKDVVDEDGLSTKMKRTSMLSDLIDTYGVVSTNPFIDYSKYDGRANLAVLTKKIDIYLTMAPPRDRPYPMTIVVVTTAKVRELIGFICWQYTSEGREPALLDNPQMYALHIAEDDGEVDTDFPSLNVKEPVSKFGFSKLALVQKSHAPSTYSTDSIIVTINIPGKGFSKVPVDDQDVQLKDILDRVVKKRKMITRPGVEYNLERQDQAGVILDLENTLAVYDTHEFCLVRRNSCRADMIDSEANLVTDSFNSHRFNTYIVSVVHKLRYKTDAQLGISGTKIDVDPVARKSTTRLFREKAVTLDMESVVACGIIEEKSNDRTSFRITYVAHNEQKYIDFEADSNVATQIVQKLTNILEWRFSPSPMQPTTLQKDRRSLLKRDMFP